MATEQPTIAYAGPDYDFWLAFVDDPDGNHVGLIREAPKGTDRG